MNEIARNTQIFLAGFVFGGTIGLIVVAACTVGKRADEWGERLLLKKGGDHVVD